jgi:uncharacterized DUF497 family protein
MNDETYIWDEHKAAANYAKHCVTFEMARDVFRDAFAIDREDSREHYNEERYTIIGMVDGRLLFVAYTMRGDIIRIISA